MAEDQKQIEAFSKVFSEKSDIIPKGELLIELESLRQRNMDLESEIKLIKERENQEISIRDKELQELENKYYGNLDEFRHMYEKLNDEKRQIEDKYEELLREKRLSSNEVIQILESKVYLLETEVVEQRRIIHSLEDQLIAKTCSANTPILYTEPEKSTNVKPRSNKKKHKNIFKIKHTHNDKSSIVSKKSEIIPTKSEIIPTKSDSVSKNSDNLSKNSEPNAWNKNIVLKNSDIFSQNHEVVSKNSQIASDNSDGAPKNIGHASKLSEYIRKNSEKELKKLKRIKIKTKKENSKKNLFKAKDMCTNRSANDTNGTNTRRKLSKANKHSKSTQNFKHK